MFVLIIALYLGILEAHPLSADVLNNVFVSVKTTGKFHKSRLDTVLNTWYKSAPADTWFFTDEDDAELSAKTGGHLVNTHCPDDHSRSSLSCKMEAELSAYLASNKNWFCHIDDDNYLNTRRLGEVLAKYPSNQDWYLGKVSIPHPLEIIDRLVLPKTRKVRFWFATGGAGFCISRSLAERMRPWVEDGKFQKLADDIRLPDDVAVGYIMEVLLDVQLNQVAEFHSHLEPLRLVSRPENEITLSYARNEETGEHNVVEMEGADEGDDKDATRFYAIHCRIYPGQCEQP